LKQDLEEKTRFQPIGLGARRYQTWPAIKRPPVVPGPRWSNQPASRAQL